MNKLLLLIGLIFFILLINQGIKDIKNTPINSSNQLVIIKLIHNLKHK